MNATNTVMYAELLPQEFSTRLQAAPIAYLPMGTLEWHGEHLPLGSDGLQSSGFFELLARRVGGIVLPMLFLGPDRVLLTPNGPLYGMDFQLEGEHDYPHQQFPGSAYHIETELFAAIVKATLKQLKRAGFKIVVAHGHGPSNKAFFDKIPEWEAQFGLKLMTCWNMTSATHPPRGLMTDHAATNETSLVMALRPDLVHIERLPSTSDTPLLGIGGLDPRVHASAELGREVIEEELAWLETALRAALNNE